MRLSAFLRCLRRKRPTRSSRKFPSKINEYKNRGDVIIATRDTHMEKAFYPEMPITLDAACCAGVTPETHDAALATMRMYQIDIISAG